VSLDDFQLTCRSKEEKHQHRCAGINAEHYQRFTSGSLSNLEVRMAQLALLFLGCAPGKIDGSGRAHPRRLTISASLRDYPQAKSSTVQPTGSCVKKREFGPKSYILANR
jgi:hypothetical protein